jgi:hypothetical protein
MRITGRARQQLPGLVDGAADQLRDEDLGSRDEGGRDDGDPQPPRIVHGHGRDTAQRPRVESDRRPVPVSGVWQEGGGIGVGARKISRGRRLHLYENFSGPGIAVNGS